MTEDTVHGWFVGRIPDGWFSGAPEITGDKEELMVVGSLPDVEVTTDSEDARREARLARIDRFREESRRDRMRIAAEAERRFRRKISWGAACGGERRLFTTLSTPMMTRLRLPERAVLDTLVDAGVARSRSDALGWCVKLVANKQGEWLKNLREALTEVEKVRGEGPGASA